MDGNWQNRGALFAFALKSTRNHRKFYTEGRAAVTLPSGVVDSSTGVTLADISLWRRGALSPQKAPGTVDSNVTLMGLGVTITLDILADVGCESAGKWSPSPGENPSFTRTEACNVIT